MGLKFAAFAGLLGIVGCAGRPAASPATAAQLEAAFSSAVDAEASRSLDAAPFLDALTRAAESAEVPGAVALAAASLDALAPGAVASDLLTPPIAYRSAANLAQVRRGLAAAYAGTSDRRGERIALIRGLLAESLHRLALESGDVAEARTWRARSGCAQGASIVGPLDAAPLTALSEPARIDPLKPLAKSYGGVAPFASAVEPASVHADACRIPVNATSTLQGLRAIVVDVHSERAQRVVFALSSSAAAKARIGEETLVERPFSLGGREATRFASATLPAGDTRVVIEVAQRGDADNVRFAAWGAGGEPLRSSAPVVGAAAPGVARDVRPIDVGSDARTAPALAAAALLAVGEPRGAEHRLESLGRDRSPAERLLYARAVGAADDMPQAKVFEIQGSELSGALRSWPDSWRAKVSHARLTQRLRGAGEGPRLALRELGVTSNDAAAIAGHDPMAIAQIAALAANAQLLDVAELAYKELNTRARGSRLAASVDFVLHVATGRERVARACAGASRRDGPACFQALFTAGDAAAASRELAFQRDLRGDPAVMRAEEIQVALAANDGTRALALYDAMQPAERVLVTLALASGDQARDRLRRDGATAQDSPTAIGKLESFLGMTDAEAPFEQKGLALVSADRAKPFLPGAGTAVLSHIERYRIEPTGLMSFVFYDLRRVSGTTDVEVGAQLSGPQLDGRFAPRRFWRRIHKQDGRILEPDATPMASQGNSDLSQLEQGDYVEQLIAGYALPGDNGQLVLDTPDLLPERTSVHSAEIRVERPESVPFSLWSHPLLDSPKIERGGGTIVSTWELHDVAPRRIEDGVPAMERGVGVSIGTLTWASVAGAMRDNLLAFDGDDPFIAKFASEAAGEDKTVNREVLARVVRLVGERVKVASSGELSDLAAVYGGGSQVTNTRSIVTQGQGSRSWVIYRVLRQLGAQVEMAVAEATPFSSSASFPPHVGRFRWPLVIARIGGEDVWVDADVDGPPLPPGQVSPELRGRSAILASGSIVAVEGASASAGDEVLAKLSLDDRGDARGTLAITLQGRAAQGLAEAFRTTVGHERMQLLRNVVLGWLPWADVESVELAADDSAGQVALTAKLQIHGYGRPEGRDGKTWSLPGFEPVHVAYPGAFAGTLGSTYASRGGRKSDLAIATALKYHVTLRIELPKGASVLRAPSSMKITDPRIEASRRSTLTGGVLEDEYRLSLPTGTIAAEDYPRFVEHVHAIDDAFMAATRIKVGP